MNEQATNEQGNEQMHGWHEWHEWLSGESTGLSPLWPGFDSSSGHM